MTHRVLIVATAVAVAGATVAYSQPPQSTPPPTSPPRAAQRATPPSHAPAVTPVSDQSFVKKLAQGGAAEVELGMLATEKAMNSEVKAFGQRMVDDHKKAGDELKSLAQKKNIAISEEPPADAKATKEKLSKLSGAAFDRAYIDDMVAGHKKVAAEVRAESRSGQDPDVRAWATKTLPTIEMHLMHAQDVQHTLHGKNATH